MESFQAKTVWGAVTICVLVVFSGLFFDRIMPVARSGDAAPIVFEIRQGEGVQKIADDLRAAGLIRSTLAFELVAVFEGKAFTLQPGLYRLDAAMAVPAIIGAISPGSTEEVSVTIPEGSNIYEIDDILSDALVIHPGSLIGLNGADNGISTLEGRLFPDTYDFFIDSDASSVVQKFLDNFNAKAQPLLAKDGNNEEKDLIIASILEKEVPSSTDQAIVAGIIDKRLAAGMPLDIDATICYIKDQENSGSDGGCYPLTSADFKIDSPYNTYRYKGLPPAPIGNPGVAAIAAALNPKSSPYWYYLTDPKTGKTIYAVTLADQNANQAKYLGN